LPALSRLAKLLLHSSNSVKKPALRAVGNIAVCSGSDTQIWLQDLGMRGQLTLLLRSENSIRKDVCQTTITTGAGTHDQVQLFANLAHCNEGHS